MSEPERVTLYVCPECGRLMLPDGTEEDYGPPECDHGLLFGPDPGGGGESEMVPVEYVPASRVEGQQREIAHLRSEIDYLLGKHDGDDPE